MLLAVLMACHPQVDAPGDDVVDRPGAVVIDLLPDPVDFGEVGIGDFGEQILSIGNSGEATVQLMAISNPSEDLFLLAPTYAPLPTGGTEDVSLMWFPAGASGLNTTLQLLFTNEEGTFWEMPLPVTGVAGGPSLTWPVEGADFGTVSVGCESAQTVLLFNAGTGDLVIDNVRLSGQREFTASGPDGEFAPFPWIIESNESREVRVNFAPQDESPASSILEISSNDPLTPVAEVPLRGSGHIDGRNSITVEVPARQNLTVLFAMNQVATRGGQFGTLFEGALPTLFDALKAEGRHYRVAFLIAQDGVVDGSVQYIDETMSTSTAMSNYSIMTAAAGGDLDTLLATLANGIAANRSWLIDESSAWRDSRLSLIGVNSDTEQSSGNSTLYVSQYRGYKSDPSDIVVHALGGDVPRGCTGGAGTAEPFELFYNAAVDTGGTFLSICDPDYEGHMEKLALGIIGEPSGFPLTGNPAASTIVVSVDGFVQETGWTYDPLERLVIFDADHYPSVGAELRIDYLMATDCPDEN